MTIWQTSAVVMLAALTPVFAQTPAAPAPAPGQPPAATAPAPPAPQGFTYNPDTRRDPFVSLLGRGGSAGDNAGVRPPGVAGLLASEVTLRGVMQGQSGFVAMLQGSDNKTYIVRPGDRLLDGNVQTITPQALVIVQQVNDPLSLVKQREVRKTLRQTSEANQ